MMDTTFPNGILIATARNSVLQAKLKVIKEKTAGDNPEDQPVIDTGLLEIDSNAIQMSDQKTLNSGTSSSTATGSGEDFGANGTAIQEQPEQLTEVSHDSTTVAQTEQEPPKLAEVQGVADTPLSLTENPENIENVSVVEAQNGSPTPADEADNAKTEPEKLAIEAITFSKKGSEGNNTIQEKSGTPIGFKVEFKRELDETEKVVLNYALYAKLSEKDGYEKIPSSQNAVNINKQQKEFSITFPEKYSGAKIGCSFFLVSPVTPRDQNESTVRYVDVLSAEGILIKDVYWSEEKSIEFGKTASSFRKITQNKTGYLHVHTRGMFGKRVKVEILEKDNIGSPALLKTCEDLIIQDNVLSYPVSMKEIYALAVNARSIAFEGDNFDIFAVVTSLGRETPLNKESDVIGLEIPNFWERMLGEEEEDNCQTKRDSQSTQKKEMKILCVNVYSDIYGPYYRGNLSLENYNNWDILLKQNKITSIEKEIIISMSKNEGNLDAVQSYDSEIVSIGAMQKTINPDGYGEFPVQMAQFKKEYPEKFKQLFENYGWTVKQENGKWRAYYKGETGAELKLKIRDGFSESTKGKKVSSTPIEPLINAAKDPYFQAKQINDFVLRLNNEVLKIKPQGYDYLLKDYLKSKLGKATVLDHHINRPGYVATDFSKALNDFYKNNPSASNNPSEWKEKHAEYEQTILDYYGNNRRGTDMPMRYKNLKNNLLKK